MDALRQQSFVVRRPTVGDVPAIAALHAAAFPSSYLTSLGVPALEVLYGAFLRRRCSICLVARGSGGELLGFVAGDRQGGERFYLSLALRYSPALLLRSRSNLRLLIVSGARRFAGRLRCPSPSGAPRLLGRTEPGAKTLMTSPGEVPRAELMSIGVSPAAEGLGVGQALLAGFAAGCEGDGYRLSTDADENDRVLTFYTKAGLVVYRTESHASGRRRVWLRSVG